LLVHPDDMPEVQQHLRAHLNGDTPFYESEHRLRHKAGHWVFVLARGKVVARDADGRPLRAAGTHLDITERKRALAALEASEERFRRLVQNSNDMILVLDAAGVCLSASGPVNETVGYAPEDLVGQSGLMVLHPDDRERATMMLAGVAATPGLSDRIEYRVQHKKTGRWVSLEAVGINLLEDPFVHGVVINVRDITQRKQAEEERARLQEQLQQALKMEAVGRLAGGIAHDFNNLLTTITGNLELARMELPPNDPLGHNLEEMHQAAERAAGLTRQLLAFSRRQIIEPKVVDLNELVDNLQKMLVRVIGEDVSLQTHLASNLGAVKVDPGQFEQVLVNLAVNARDAMPDGGRLLIDTANVELDEAYCASHPEARPGSFVMLAVSDTGHGMSEEVRRRIFEPFFTTKPKGRGTGLGLATIFGTVKQAGGTIQVYSEVGLGTSFKIYLPRVSQAPESLSAEPPGTQALGGKETILVVEDERSVRDLALLLLRRLGYQVLHAASGEEALALAAGYTQHIDLLMTDVVMPGMNGRELGERLHLLHPETAVLFTSGYTEDIVVHHGVAEESLNFIGKPYTMQGLASKIREVLALRLGREH
jgi:PAS domain S-box-containing protein